MDEMQREDLTRFLPRVKFEAIPISQLVTDQQYQRNISLKHVKRAAENFDPYQVNPVKVSRRNGINYVFNGQHTMAIVESISGSRETPVWCMVYDGLEYSREADIFANQQKYVKPLTPYEIFMANIEAGNDKQILIKTLVESYCMRVSPPGIQNGICAVATLEYIFDRYGYEILSRTLRLVILTWEGIPLSLSAGVLKGLAKLLEIFGTEIKDDVFTAKLGTVSIKELVRSAKERAGGSMGYAEAMLVYYNKKLSKPLAQERLYAHKSRKEHHEKDCEIPENELVAEDAAIRLAKSEPEDVKVNEETMAESTGNIYEPDASNFGEVR